MKQAINKLQAYFKPKPASPPPPETVRLIYIDPIKYDDPVRDLIERILQLNIMTLSQLSVSQASFFTASTSFETYLNVLDWLLTVTKLIKADENISEIKLAERSSLRSDTTLANFLVDERGVYITPNSMLSNLLFYLHAMHTAIKVHPELDKQIYYYRRVNSGLVDIGVVVQLLEGICDVKRNGANPNQHNDGSGER